MNQLEKVNYLRDRYSVDLKPDEKIDLLEECEETTIKEECVKESPLISIKVENGRIRINCNIASKINLFLTIIGLIYSMSIVILSLYQSSISNITINMVIHVSLVFVLLVFVGFRIPVFISKTLGKQFLDETSMKYFQNQNMDLQKHLEETKNMIEEDIVKEYCIEDYKERFNKN